jgi:tRNA-modifying protein YgfZ
MPIACLPERGVIRVSGPDARSFLQGLLTCDIERISPEKTGYGALLTPQGKIIADFLIIEAPEADGGGFYLDCLVTRVAEILKRLKLYKLRARVVIEDMSESLGIAVLWGKSVLAEADGLVFTDPRLAALGQRALVERSRAESLADTPAEVWNNHRIALGVPDGGKDFAYDNAFPHEALLDQLDGVDFRKGCYVGQEVVSRMEHRGSARSRIVPIVFIEGIVSEWGLEARAGTKIIGRVGSTGQGRGLALLRLDRVADAIAAGQEMSAGGLAFRVEKAGFARFAMPGEAVKQIAREQG